MRARYLTVSLLVTALCAAGGCISRYPDIRIDGRFEDWDGASPRYTDPAGDGGASGIDIGRVWITEGADTFCMRFEVGEEISLQSGNDLVLYLDTDNSAETGLPVDGIGADLSWRFGGKRGYAHLVDGPRPLSAYEVGLVTAPTTTSRQFEIKFLKDADIAGVPPLLEPGTIRWLLRDEGDDSGDRAPDPGETARYLLKGSHTPRFQTCTLAKEADGHLRIVTYNVYEDNIFKQQDTFSRIMKALDPDVINLQEIRRHPPGQVKDLITRMLGGTWHEASHVDCFTLSRYPIVKSVPAEGSMGVLIDTPGERYDADLFIINAHLGSGSKDARRQREADSIIALIRDARKPGGEIGLAPGTPIVLVGDLNLVGGARQLQTLLTGDIVNEGVFGPDAPPDWDATPMTDLVPYHIAAPEAYTWSHYRRKGYSPGRLDYIIYTDSAASVAKCFVLSTDSMSGADLAAAGLRRDDSSTASDHLPVVADFILGSATRRSHRP